MPWLKRGSTDTGTLDLAPVAPGMTAGTWTLRRTGQWVYMNLYVVSVPATAGTYWMQSGWLPSGFRPPASSQYVTFPCGVQNANFTPGPLRVDRYGGVTVYGVTDKTVSVTASWVTDDAWPSTLPGVKL